MVEPGHRRPHGAGGARFGRRRLLGSAAGMGLVALTSSCGEDRASPGPTATPIQTVPAPTPTQPPIASPVSGYLDPERWVGRTLTVGCLGGYYQDAQNEAFFEPFMEATGALLQQKLLGGDLSEFRSQVERESVVWDIVDLPTDEVLPLAREDYLTPIDYQVVAKTTFLEPFVMQHGVASSIFSTVLSYSAHSERKPDGWRDFWDIKYFPGGRALKQSPVGTLEFSLLADGVEIDRLYPLDVERAFRSLERIRSDVVQWYDNTKQPVALLLSGDATMASTFSVRALPPETVEEVGLQWRGGMLSSNSWVVPRGSPNSDVAMDFINFATRAVPSANLSRLVPFGPVNRDAFDLLRDDRIDVMPNTAARYAVQFVENWAWWADNRVALVERFDRWRSLDVDPAAPGVATP